MINIKQKFSGAFDLLFLFGRGIKKFEDTKKEALQSLIPAVILLPLGLVFALFYPPKGMEYGFSAMQISLTVLTHDILTFIFANGLVMGLASLLGKAKKFWLFFSAGNWTGAAFSLASLPFAIAAVTGIVARPEMDRVFVLLACYSYIVTACIAWRAFKIGWEFAGVFAIVILFVNQELWHFLFLIQGIPIPW